MTNQHEETVEILNVFFEQWKEEHLQLDKYVLELSDWSHLDSQHQCPQFKEAADRLRGLEQRLVQHFSKETAIGLLLAEARGIATPEIEAARRQADKDHKLLADRLTRLIDLVNSASGDDVALWQKVRYELNLFLDVLEQHEELEAENVRWLIPTSPSH